MYLYLRPKLFFFNNKKNWFILFKGQTKHMLSHPQYIDRRMNYRLIGGLELKYIFCIQRLDAAEFSLQINSGI